VSTPDPLHALLQQVERLWPDWRDQRAFHEGKSELLGTIKGLIASGGAPGRRPPAPVPTPRATPARARAPAAARSAPARPNLLVVLPPERHLLLLALATAPTRCQPQPRSFQHRAEVWCAAVDETQALLTLAITPRDADWIAKQIRHRRCGGYQGKIARIFMDLHPLFTGIAAIPRRPPSQRKKRVRRTAPGGEAAAAVHAGQAAA
jgi:hypothetical protein